jgi:superfamily II DNA or RNA helicase
MDLPTGKGGEVMRAAQMQQAMENDGLQPAEQIIADSVFRRIDDTNGKPGNKLIGYVNHVNAGYYCHWSKMPVGRTWSIKNETDFTPEEKRDFAVKMQQARKDREAAETQRRKECRELVSVIWGESQLATDSHPYLVKKGVQAHGLKLYNGRLVVPVYDTDSVLHGLQYLTTDFKWFEDGTAVKGNFAHIAGDNDKPIYVCEGWATGATIHETTGATVVIAFGCGNLRPVMEAIRTRVGAEKSIVVCADNDRLTTGNPGLTHATAASTAVNAGLAIPIFPGDMGTDFNDMTVLSGIPAVKNVLEAASRSLPPAILESAMVPAVQQYQLRPYQEKALCNIKQAIATGFHSIMIQSPTGSGKGVMLSHIIHLCHQKGSTVLFLVHNIEILYQVSDYLNKWGIEHGIIKAGEKHEDRHPVQLASFQTLYRRIKNPFIKKADVVIIDEAHHATATTFIKVIEEFRKKVVLGFSATPMRNNGLGLGNLFDKMIQVATISELIALGYLVPVRVYAPVRPDLAGVKVTAGDYNTRDLETAMNKPTIVGDVVGHYQQFGQNRKAICFATGVKHSIALCQQFHAAGITAAHVDGKTPKEERDSILSRFKAGSIQIIVNCQVFTEGVDVPDIGCVILARPTKSLGMYLQMTGRGMRIFPGKEDCILLDHAGAVHEHGFPDEITEWELSTTTRTVNKKNEQRKKKESEPISCPVCDLLYTAQLQCPGCGNIPTIKQIGKDIKYIDGELGEIVRKSSTTTKKPKVKEPTSEEKAAWFRQLKLYCQQQGHNTGWISHKFREKFGIWPNKYASLPAATEVSPEVMGYIRYSNIRRVKSPAQMAA